MTFAVKTADQSNTTNDIIQSSGRHMLLGKVSIDLFSK